MRRFYDDSILPGTKTDFLNKYIDYVFYDDSILPGTKTTDDLINFCYWFYDDSILPGTKTQESIEELADGFMMTQFFQVLKLSVVLL